jgi:hypothetical protein
MNVISRYQSVPLAAGASFTLPQGAIAIGYFLCTVSGTLTATDGNGIVKLLAFPVTAGNYYPLPIILQQGGSVTLTTAAGTLGYGA